MIEKEVRSLGMSYIWSPVQSHTSWSTMLSIDIGTVLKQPSYNVKASEYYGNGLQPAESCPPHHSNNN
jgi:hypothetical protein